VKSFTTIFPSKDFNFFFAVPFLGFIQREGVYYANGFLVNEFSGELCAMCVMCLVEKKCLLMYVGSGMKTSPKLRKPSQKE